MGSVLPGGLVEEGGRLSHQFAFENGIDCEERCCDDQKPQPIIRTKPINGAAIKHSRREL